MGVDVYERLHGGGGVISMVLTQSGRFFGRFRGFLPRLVWTLPRNWFPPISDMENSKIKVSWPNKTVAGLSEVIFRKFAATGLAYVQGFHCAWPGAQTYSHYGKFR